MVAPDAADADPRRLLPSTFTTAEARAAGLSAGRLRGPDVVALARGIHRWRDAVVPGWPDLGLPPAHHGRDRDFLAAVLRSRPDAVLARETAAHLHGFPGPRGLRGARPAVQVSVPAQASRLRRPGVDAHRRPLPAEHLTHVLGLRATTPVRTWLDLTRVGDPWDEAALVVVADVLVNRPWSPHGRRPASTDVAAIRAAADSLGAFWGTPAAERALARVRVGADSPQETLLRLALVDAGLGEPLLQHRIDPSDPRCPEADLLYEDCRLVLQYDGAVHRTPEQQARDARRDQYFAERDHMTLHVTVEDARAGYGRVIEAVRERRRRQRRG